MGECSRPSQFAKVAVGHGFDALWLHEDATAGPLSVEIDGPLRQEGLDLAYARVVRDLYHMPTGYLLIVPPEGAIVTECPPGHMTVYTHHFEFGLCFLLDSFLVEILNASNVFLAQLTPLAVQNLIAYIWVVRFLDFRHIRWLKKNRSSRQSGWWSLMTVDKKTTVQPKISGLKG